MVGVGGGHRVYAVGNEGAEPNLEGLRSWLSRLVDPILPLFLEEHTTYAPGFREQAFRSLRAGMTEKDVRQALGAPLSDRVLADGRKVQCYSEQATPTANYFMRLVVLDGQGRLREAANIVRARRGGSVKARPAWSARARRACQAAWTTTTTGSMRPPGHGRTRLSSHEGGHAFTRLARPRRSARRAPARPSSLSPAAMACGAGPAEAG